MDIRRCSQGLLGLVGVGERLFLHVFERDGSRAVSSAREKPVDLLRNADLAIYGAENKGKTRYEVFEPGVTRRSTRRLEMESDLRRALERDEFKVL